MKIFQGPRNRPARSVVLVATLATLTLGLGSPAQAAAPAAPSAHGDFLYHVECDPPLWLDPYAIDDTDTARVKYREPWKLETPGRELYKGTQHITNWGGATVSFALPSAPYMFAFGFTKMRNAGKAAIYFDNRPITTIDMYAPVTDYNCALFLYGGVPQGTFMVKVLNQQSPSSSGTYVNIDYIYFEP